MIIMIIGNGDSFGTREFNNQNGKKNEEEIEMKIIFLDSRYGFV